MATDTQNVYILGKIPGYNSVIDPDNYFGKILLRDITFIDLIPAVYKLNSTIKDAMTNVVTKAEVNTSKIDFSTLYEYESGSTTKSLAIYKSVILKMANHLESLWINGNDALVNRYSGIAGAQSSSDNLKSRVTDIINEFKGQEAIRILAANDSTFTETISNNFGDTGALDMLSGSILGKMPNAVQQNASLIQKVQKVSYESALETLSAVSSKGGIFDIISGKALGIQFSSPKAWTDSNYASTLSIFIKLASPSGHPVDVLQYITLPILTFMAAGSPLTQNGVTYGLPLVWDVRAYGITRFKVGALAAMTISRGSYETVFNAEKQPLVVDVRLNIIPLIQDFAVQYDSQGITSDLLKTARDNISKVTDAAVPKSEAKDTEKEHLSFSASFFSSLASMLNTITTSVTENMDTITDGDLKINVSKNNYYETDKYLGVQSPKNEIDGLLGLAAKSGKVDSKNYSPKIPTSEMYSYIV